MSPSATDRSSAAVSAVTPLPIRSGTSGTALRTRLDLAERRRLARRRARDDQRIGETAVHEIARRLLGSRRARGNGVLAAGVGENRDVDAREAAGSRSVPYALGLDDALVGREHVHPRRAIDADELGADRGGDRQRRARVVLQDVQRPGLRGEDARRTSAATTLTAATVAGSTRPGVKGVAEVLDRERVHAAVDERAGVGQRRRRSRRASSRPTAGLPGRAPGGTMPMTVRFEPHQR